MTNTILNPLQKTLVVGLGGTGKKVLVQLKRRLREEGFADTPRQPDLRLLCLDFDPAEECTALRNDGGGEVRLAPDEICWLDAGAIQRRLRNMSQPHNKAYYQQWYPDQEGTVIQMGSYRAGAAQWRPLGRIGYYEHVERIQVVLRRSLNRLLEVDVARSTEDAPHGVAVYLVCSLAGGTGGGIFTDVAYFLRTLPVDLTQSGLFLLPGIYAEYDISGRLFANTYACLKELAVFANQTKRFSAQYPNGRRISVGKHGQGPFDQILLYDNILLADQVTNNPQMMAAIMAETIFFDLAEARIGQMHQSSITNAAAQSGAHEDGELARQSVFSTAGAVTLLLPSLNEIRDFWARRYVLEMLTPELARAGERILDAERREPPSQAWRRELFPGLENRIGRTAQKAREGCLPWPQTYIAENGASLGDDLLKFRLEPEQAIRRLERWLDELAQPGPEGRFTNVPNYLPDTDPETDKAALRKSLEGLRREIARAVDNILDAEQAGADARADDIYWYLRSKAEVLRGEAREFVDALKASLKAKGRTFDNLKQDLLELFEADPPNEGGIARLAVSHWARRFLRAVQNSYEEYACAIRVNYLTAEVLEQVCREKFIDDATLESVLRAAPEIRAAVLKEADWFQEHLERRNNLVVRSLADQSFWDRLSKRLDGLQAAEGALAGFILHVKQRLKESPDQAGLSVGRLAEMALEFARDAMAKGMAGSKDILELHDYVDPKLRVEEMSRARHDYMLSNVMFNANENRRAYAMIPAYSRKSSQADNGEHYRALDGDVGNVLSAVPAEVATYDAHEALGDDKPGKLLIRHLSLNHPAANLRGIGEYYFAYARYGKNRKLFHIDAHFNEFPEVIDESQQVQIVTCGNPGCEEDISDLARSTLICPACERPIKSRCGNPDCPEDQLHLTSEMAGPNPDKSCPTCGKPALTYWWRCDRHNEDIRTDSNFCIHCVAENLDKGDQQYEPSRRDGVKPFIFCPGCIHDCIEEPFKIEFLEVYDQVPDDRIKQAWEVFHKDTRQGYCPKCGARLLPFCPHQKADEHPRHFVQRRQTERNCARKKDVLDVLESRLVVPEGRFYCTSDQGHAEMPIHECSFCHLPLKEGDTYCPRCKKRRLVDSSRDGLDKALAKILGTSSDKQADKNLLEAVNKKIIKDHWIFFGLREEARDQLSREPNPDSTGSKDHEGKQQAGCDEGEADTRQDRERVEHFNKGAQRRDD